ncbi:MAG: TetR/AcrR family transcriptional regulator [Lachnospiraceae bacterium]|nr:TetR/AcrR family transcriptional regulator [Lachnospiraceae bacterium]
MDNRGNILDVALHMFSDKGYDAVSVQEIVESAGITKPTLYYYFGSKYGLLEAILEDGFSKLDQMIGSYIDEDSNDVREQLFKVAKAFLTFAVEESRFFSFMLSLMYSAKGGEPYKAVKPHLHKLYQAIIDMFERSSSQLGNMNGRQEQFAMGYLGFLNQYVFTFSERNFFRDNDLREHINDDDVRSLIQQFMYGIVS